MKTQLTKNGLQPPERNEHCINEEFEKWRKIISKEYLPSEVFDLYEHDREVALKFYKWALDYSSTHLPELLEGKYPNHEMLFEIYCTETKK